MKNLQHILSAFAAMPPRFGDLEKAERTASEIESLKSDVLEISRRDKMYFTISFAALIVLFAAAFVLAASSLRDPDRIKTILAGSGVSFFALIGWMLKLWKEKVASDLTLALAANLRPEDVRPTLEIVLRGLRK